MAVAVCGVAGAAGAVCGAGAVVAVCAGAVVGAGVVGAVAVCAGGVTCRVGACATGVLVLAASSCVAVGSCAGSGAVGSVSAAGCAGAACCCGAVLSEAGLSWAKAGTAIVAAPINNILLNIEVNPLVDPVILCSCWV